jgi:hypothetical protein
MPLQRKRSLPSIGMRDGAPIELISARTEKTIDRFNNLARKDLRHCGSLANEVFEVQMILRSGDRELSPDSQTVMLSDGTKRAGMRPIWGKTPWHVELTMARRRTGHNSLQHSDYGRLAASRLK